MNVIEIFTDGACRGNPGPGGWGVFLRYRDQEQCLLGHEIQTTNNRMELSAALFGLNELNKSLMTWMDHRPTPAVHVVTDSVYLRSGITQWILTWEKNNWRTKTKKEVKNIDLWTKLIILSRQFQVQWFWVRGHNQHRENELADQLANQAVSLLMKTCDA